MKLVRTRGVELVAKKSFEVAVTDEMGPLALEMMVGADLQIPGVADKDKLEEAVEDLARQHLVGGNDLGMAGDLAGDAMPGQPADTAADELGNEVGITPAQAVESGADTGAGGLGDMDEEKFVTVADEHVNSYVALIFSPEAPSVGDCLNRSYSPTQQLLTSLYPPGAPAHSG